MPLSARAGTGSEEQAERARESRAKRRAFILRR